MTTYRCPTSAFVPTRHLTSFGIVDEEALLRHLFGKSKGKAVRSVGGNAASPQVFNAMRFGFEYEILVSGFTKYTPPERMQQLQDAVQPWTVTSDYSVRHDADTKTYGRSPSSPDHAAAAASGVPGAGYYGWEIISPVIEGYQEIRGVFKAFDAALKRSQFKFRNNTTTSNHVHISHPLFRDPVYLTKVVLAWLHYEDDMLSFVHEARRDNKFCLSNARYLQNKHGTDAYAKFMASGELRHLGGLGANSKTVKAIVGTVQNDRRFALNLMNLLDGGIGTIEVRIKHGSNDMAANATWIEFLAVFFAAALQSPPIYEMDKKDLAAFCAGAGTSADVRLPRARQGGGGMRRRP